MIFNTSIKNFFSSNSLSINKLKSILTLIDKKRNKKIVNLITLFNNINQAIKKKNTYLVAYTNTTILLFLTLLKKYGFIFNYYHVPNSFFKLFLHFGYKPLFHNRVAIIYFKKNTKFGVALNNIITISKPSRQVYISYSKLRKLIKTQQITGFFILNTTKGIISHVEALHHKIGGNLLCLVR